MRWTEWRVELLLAAAIWAFNLLGLGHVGLFDVDEAIFGEATREMVETGDFVTPTYNYGVRWDKPPLIYWVMSGPVRVFGPTSFGARFTSATFSALLALGLMACGRRLFDALTGRLAGIMLPTCLHGFVLGHMSLTDMVLTTFMAAAWLCLYLAGEERSPRWFAAAAVALGLGTLTKGPVAVVLPLGTWLIYLLARRELRAVLRAVRPGRALVVYTVLVAPWAVAIYQRHGTAFYESFLGYHNLNRLTTTQSGHGGQFYTFVLVLLVGLAPWSGFLLAGLGEAWRQKLTGERGRALGYVALWLLAVVGLFSASRTKLPNYIAPAYPAAALLAASAATRVWRGDLRRWPPVVGPTLLGLALTALAVATMGRWLPGLAVLQRELPGATLTVGLGPAVAGWVMLALTLAALMAWLRRSADGGVVALAAAGAGSWLALWLGVAPVVYHYQQGTLRVMTLEAARYRADGDVATLNMHQPSVPLTLRGPFLRYTLHPGDDPGLLRARWGEPRPLFLLTRHNRLGEALDGLTVHRWAERYGWLLLSNIPPPPGYELPPSPWREADVRRLPAAVEVRP